MRNRHGTMPKIWRRAWPIALSIATIWLAGCAGAPQRVVGQIHYSDTFLDKLADEVDQSQCGPRCVAALADWEVTIVQ